MDKVEIKDFKYTFSTDELLQKAQLANAPGNVKARFNELAEQAGKVVNSSGFALIMALDDRGAEDETHLGNEVFKSGLLRQKTSGLGRVFPYIVTEGRELAQWGQNLEEMKDIVMSRAIRQAAVKACEAALEKALKEKYGIPVLSSMNPGSLADWPIQEQAKMFRLLTPGPENLGISLLPSMIMQPDYSISGIFFQTDKKFYNCQLCPRDDCPNRRAKKEIA